MNKDKFSWFLNKFFFIHPIAIVLIFFINSFELVRYNESVSSIEIIASITLTIAFLLFSYLLFRKLIKNNFIAAFLTSSFILFCFFFSDIFVYFYSIHFIKILVKFVFFNRQITALVFLLSGLIIILTICLMKLKIKLLKLTWFLNLITLVFLFMRLIQFIQANNIIITFSNKDTINDNNNLNSSPNIYYIILDSYTGNKSLKKYWNFDNSEFTDYLRNRGFYIAESNSNYNWTPFSLSSSLNMSYLDFDRTLPVSNEHFHNLFKLIQNNRVVDFLRKNNYTILNYSFFDITNTSKFYKNYFFFNERFFSQSIFFIIYSKISEIWTDNEITHLAGNNLAVIKNIKNLELSRDKHFFVYAHILLPHAPYFFDHSGKLMSTAYAIDVDNQMKYLEQLRYTNKLMQDCIETILNHSTSKPIIIIQGDHGFRYLDHRDQLAESFTILNAYYFPDQKYFSLYDSISPVNSFRIVFNKYFNKNLPLLNDNSINVMPQKMFSR